MNTLVIFDKHDDYIAVIDKLRDSGYDLSDDTKRYCLKSPIIANSKLVIEIIEREKEVYSAMYIEIPDYFYESFEVLTPSEFLKKLKPITCKKTKYLFEK